MRAARDSPLLRYLPGPGQPVRVIQPWPEINGLATSRPDGRQLLPGAGTLSDEEVYGLTALLLFRNGIIAEEDVMDATSLPQVVMPNRDRYTVPPEDWQPGRPRPWTSEP